MFLLITTTTLVGVLAMAAILSRTWGAPGWMTRRRQLQQHREAQLRAANAVFAAR